MSKKKQIYYFYLQGAKRIKRISYIILPNIIYQVKYF